MASLHTKPFVCTSLHCASTAILASLLLLQLLLAPRSSPQTATQQRVYGAASATTAAAILPGYDKDSSTGALSLLPGAPFADRLEGGLLAVDGQGKFLFVLNPVSNSISMFQIDGSTGALTEVPNSPFAAGPTVNPNVAPSLPVSLATEKNGNFLYVGYANGDSATTAALVPFAIDTANLRLTLTPQLSLDFGNGAPVQMLADPKGLHLYVGLGPGGSQGSSSAGTEVYAIDSSSGVLTPTGNAGGGTEWGRCIAIDPQGRFFFDGWGQSEGFLDSGVISPVDGTSAVSSTLSLGAGVFPSALLVDSSGKFLYAQTGAGLLIYSIDGTSGALTLLNGPLLSFTFATGKVAADPMGPYLYSLGRSGVDVFQIDSASGNLTEIPGAPFPTGASGPAGSLGLAISGAAIESVSGPAAEIFPTSQDFGQVALGRTSTTKIISLVNVGSQILAISRISVTGTNAGDFSQSSTCGATLAANANCSVSILFTPSLAGLEQASLQVSDNAPGSPQSAALTGTGVGAQASVTLVPGSVNFGSLAQSATSSQTVTLTNSGSGPLHVASIALSGPNPGDFSQTNTCLGTPVAIQAICTITLKFAPQAEGQRSASLVIMDDAPGSPQNLSLTGSGVAAFQLAAASGSTTAATVTAGQTALYSLQLTPGPSFAGAVTLSCTGAPLAATCNASPASLNVSASGAVAVQVSIATTSSGFAPPPLAAPTLRAWPLLVLSLAYALLLPLLAKKARTSWVHAARAGAFTGVLVIAAAGCGGGSSVSSAAPQFRTGTPQGTSTITITAQSGTLPAQTLQLTLTVN